MSLLAVAVAVLIVFEADRRIIRHKKFNEESITYSHKEVYILSAIAISASLLIQPMVGLLIVATIGYFLFKKRDIFAKLK
jgi:uncharacterized membrane protein